MVFVYGVPLMIATDSQNKPEIAARVEWSGVGIHLRTGAPRPRRIRRAVRSLVDDARYIAAARRIAAEIASMPDGPGAAASLIEEVARSGRPVEAPPPFGFSRSAH